MMGRGQRGGADGEGATGRGRQGNWQTGGGEEGARGGGGFHRWIEMIGWTGHMECLGGTRLPVFYFVYPCNARYPS